MKKLVSVLESHNYFYLFYEDSSVYRMPVHGSGIRFKVEKVTLIDSETDDIAPMTFKP